jgi:hypothetical protein
VYEFFSIYLILPAALGLGVRLSASYRNEYQKQRSNVPGQQSIAVVFLEFKTCHNFSTKKA